MKMIILSSGDVRRLFPMKDAIESNRTAFLLHAQGHTELPVRISFAVSGDDTSQLMPAFVKDRVNRVGVKIVSTFPSNTGTGVPIVNAQVLLLDPSTGEVSAMINGTEITRIRTGAISGVATDILARQSAEVGALFGVGGQALGQLEAMLTVRKLKEVRIYDIAEGRIAQFIESTAELAASFGTKLRAAGSPDEAIDEADIITTATISKTPTFKGSRVKPGAHVNGVGSYRPTVRELDFDLIKRGRVFVDNREAVVAEAGDIIIPVNEGAYSFDMIAGELGDVLAGKIAGRQSEDQITVMKTVGYAVLDVVAAWNILNKATALGVGQRIEI